MKYLLYISLIGWEITGKSEWEGGGFFVQRHKGLKTHHYYKCLYSSNVEFIKTILKIDKS